MYLWSSACDLSCRFTYLVYPQIMLPEAIAIVMAPTDNSRYVIAIIFSVNIEIARTEFLEVDTVSAEIYINLFCKSHKDVRK
jgi:hypothetical protein